MVSRLQIRICPLVVKQIFNLNLNIQTIHNFTSVYLYASSAVHSALLVGLERANIIGLSLKSAIRFKIAGVNAPP